MSLTLSTNASQLDRFLGPGMAEHISQAMREWYGPPVAVAGVPGAVFAHKGGDFRGPIKAGGFLDHVEFAATGLAKRFRKAAKSSLYMPGAGFSSLSDLIAEATTGKARDIYWQKTGPTGVIAVTSSLWKLGAQPAAGAVAAAAPGGTVPTGATTGAVYGLDNVSADTRHIVSGQCVASQGGNTLLMYDRLFAVAKTMNSGTTESVTGVPTRYQSSTVTAADYAGGNFAFVEVGGTALAATAHNWTVCRYRNQAGTDAQTFPSMTGNSAAIIHRLDHPASSWFFPLASGDTGVMDLDQMQCSAAVATGVVDFVIGHPLAWLPCPVSNYVCSFDGINTAFNLVRVFDGAALAFLEVSKPSTTSTVYNGTLKMVHG